MNSYFDHGANGFYNPAHHSSADAHQVAYRSFTQGLVPLMPSASSAYQGSRSSSAAASSDSTNYSETSKIYDSSAGVNGQPTAFKSEPSSCGASAKDQNGFKAPERLSPPSWNSPLRPSPSTPMTSDPIRSFDSAARSVPDPWSACCQGTSAAAAVGAPTNAFYPWMGIPHPQSRPDASSYLTEEHRTPSYSDAYSSRLILGDTSNYHHHASGLQQGSASSGEYDAFYT